MEIMSLIVRRCLKVICGLYFDKCWEVIVFKLIRKLVNNLYLSNIIINNVLVEFELIVELWKYVIVYLKCIKIYFFWNLSREGKGLVVNYEVFLLICVYNYKL